jgi:hypothetical protein
MFEQPLTSTVPGPEVKIEHLIARVPALEVPLDTPTVEQIHANDEVFKHPAGDSDNAAGLIGMVTGMMLLHDVAKDTLQDLDDLEGHMQREKRKDGDDEEN